MNPVKVNRLESLRLKMDKIEAYDRVNWTFLRLVLLQIGLSVDVVNWIMECVTSTNFVVLINGRPSNSFSASHGL